MTAALAIFAARTPGTAAFFTAVDDARRDRDLGWYDLAGELWDQSAKLNAERDDHPLCGVAVSRLGARARRRASTRSTCCAGSGRHRRSSSPVRLWTLGTCGCRTRVRTVGSAGTSPSSMPRSTRSGSGGLTWAGLAGQIGCTPSRLTNLRTARMADMALTMRVTQWLHKPAAEFIHPASIRHRAELL